MAEATSRAEEMGARGRRSGGKLTDNPFSRDTATQRANRRLWEAGWKEQDEKTSSRGNPSSRTGVNWTKTFYGWAAGVNGKRLSVSSYRAGTGKGLVYVARVNESAASSPAKAYSTAREAKAEAELRAELIDSRRATSSWASSVQHIYVVHGEKAIVNGAEYMVEIDDQGHVSLNRNSGSPGK